ADVVRLYLQAHRESSRVAAGLWRAAREASGAHVARLAQAWIGQAGFPLVTLARNGRALRVRQERFFADPRVPAAKRRHRWPVPLVVRLQGSGQRLARALVGKASESSDLPAPPPPLC